VGWLCPETARDNKEGGELEELEEALPARVRPHPRRRQRIAGVLRGLLAILKEELEDKE
jgi:hypothetical protein